MTLLSDTQIDLSEHNIESKYIISSQHRRNGNVNKSIWIINHSMELRCFIQTINEKWFNNFKGWGLIQDGENLEVLGLNNDNGELKLAKFVDANTNNIWHGYPADCMNRPQDIPLEEILKKWVENKFITKAKMNKIRRGISCNL